MMTGGDRHGLTEMEGEGTFSSQPLGSVTEEKVRNCEGELYLTALQGLTSAEPM